MTRTNPLTTLLAILILVPTATAIPYKVVKPGIGIHYDGHSAVYPKYQQNMPSGVNGLDRYDTPKRHNPFYVENEKGGQNHINVHTQMENQYRTTPELFRPRVSVGPIGY